MTVYLTSWSKKCGRGVARRWHWITLDIIIKQQILPGKGLEPITGFNSLEGQVRTHCKTNGSRQLEIHATVSLLSLSRGWGREELRGFGSLSSPGPRTMEVGVARYGSVTWKPVPLLRASDAHCPHQGRQLLLQSTRCQASTPVHFSGRSSGPPPSFLLTHLPVKHPGPRPTPPSAARAHALHAGSAFQLRLGIGRFGGLALP